MNANEYNRKQIKARKLSAAQVDQLVTMGATAVQTAAGLTVDGKAGPATRKALAELQEPALEVLERGGLPAIPAGVLDTSGLPDGGSDLARQMLARIRWYASQRAREIGGNNSGPWVAHFHQIPNDGDPDDDGSWCASTVATCLEEAAAALGVAVPADYSRRQRGGARALGARIGAGGQLVGRATLDGADVLPGDVVVWDRGTAGSWQAHIEIVSQYDAAHDELESYGGNVGSYRRIAGRIKLNQRQQWRRRLVAIYRLGA